jgi:hypothetical protein
MKDAEKILILLLLGLTLNLNAQTLDTLLNRSTNLTLSYNSSLIYPGARFGFELPVRSIELIKKKSNREKIVIKDRFITAQIGWYHHPSFHDNLYLTGGWTMRRIRPKGFFTQFSPEIGYSRTFIAGATYIVDENDEIHIKKIAGNNFLLLSLGVGLGYDFEKTKNKPFSIYSKFNVLLMYPYNSTFYLRPTMELGFIYKPENFLSHNVKSKIKTK